jgi:hypothetical protein
MLGEGKENGPFDSFALASSAGNSLFYYGNIFEIFTET